MSSSKNPVEMLTLIRVVAGLITIFIIPSASSDDLTLQEVERQALLHDPAVMALDIRAQAFLDQAVANGQLPDPKLKLGTMNVPLDSFDFDQEPMSQLQLGIQQAVPPGQSLRYRREYSEALADIENARRAERRLHVLREVRILYLDRYLQEQSVSVLQQNRDLFTELRDTTQRQYAAGRDNQHDIMRAQLELSLVDDRILEIERAREAAIAKLSRYLPTGQAQQPIAVDFPVLQPLPGLATIHAGLTGHPVIRIEDAAVLASRKKVNEAEQKYKPGIEFDVTYGKRFGSTVPGDSRSDLLSAMVWVDLPLFTNKRQDRQLSAARKQNQSMQYSRTDRLYELNSMLESEHANWSRLSERLQLYEKRAVSDARMNSESTLKAYQNDIADFTTLMRAQLLELDTRLDMLRVRVEQAKVHARLLYLAGE